MTSRRSMAWMVPVAGLLMGGGSIPASAGTILQDTFDGPGGSAIDATKWTAGSAAAVQLDGNGSVKLDADAGPNKAYFGALGGAEGSFTFQPTATDYARLTATGYNHTIGGFSNIGLTTSSPRTGATEIMLRTVSTPYHFLLQVASGSKLVQYITDVPFHSSTGDWEIDWYTNRIVALYNGEVKVDTNTSPIYADYGSGGLEIPTVPMFPHADKWGGDYLTIDGITWESVPLPVPHWINASGGDWNDPANWDGGVPNSAGAVANFLDAITSPQTIFTNAAVTVGTIKFDNANKYLIGGTGSLTLEAAAGSALVSVVQGGHEINLPLHFASNSDVTIAAGATLTISDPATIRASKIVTKSGDLSVQAALTIEDGGALVLASGPTRLFGIPSLGSGAKIDVKGNAVTIDYTGEASPADAIKAQIAGGGIMSSSAVAGQTGVGWKDDSASQSILVKYTYLGDTNLDGQVDVIDLGNLATAWQTAGVWANGDSNYDSFIDVIDLGLLATNWQAGVGNPLGPGSLDRALASYGLPGVAVPEPCFVGLAGALGLLSRRRR